MKITPTKQPRTFHIMTHRGGHSFITEVQAVKSLEEAVERWFNAHPKIKVKEPAIRRAVAGLTKTGRVIYNSSKSVIIVH